MLTNCCSPFTHYFRRQGCLFLEKCVKDCPGLIKYKRYGLLVETRSSRTGMDSLLPVHFIMKHCAFNNPFPALFYFPHWPHWWPLHDLLISHCDLESWFAMTLSSKTRYRDDFASMQSFAGALILKHQMRRAQLHKNQNCSKRLKGGGLAAEGFSPLDFLHLFTL